MHKDIKFYDIRYSKIKFKKIKTGSSASTIVCKFMVKGSSENRPKINPGSSIRFRPAQEDLALNRFPLFELVGIITDIKLQTEMVTCVCVHPPQNHSYMFGQPQYNLSLLNRLRYHTRFTFDLCGAAFVQKAIMNILDSAPLQLVTFPPREFSLNNPYTRLLDISEKITMDVNLNLEQIEAVETVSALYLRGKQECHLKSFVPTPPYIIYGPPGTGKEIKVTKLYENNFSNRH